jgi:hypothetical protein
MRPALSLTALVLVIGVGALLSRPQQEAFPHARHQGVFPTCFGCHAGIESGNREEAISAQPDLCAACHDGENLPGVSWEGPDEKPADNLRAVHPGHPDIGCAACHQIPGASGDMEVQAASAESCMICHAPGAEEHQAAGVPCTQCHQPLGEVPDISAEAIGAFPRPGDHGAPDFLSAHGAAAGEDVSRCSVCHARESCTRCHANAASVAPIMALPRDARAASLVAGREGSWPLPASHQSPDWKLTHADDAVAAPQTCSTCHAREACAACHLDTTDRVAEAFPPTARAVGGAMPEQPAVPGHVPGFAVGHGEAAVASLLKCAACHAESFCIDCHDAPGRPYFHPANFVTRHAAEAWAEPLECAECHSREVFCRDCHRAVGTGQNGNLNGGYHDADPDWFLSHGRAARQALETCTSCHQQESCLRCHSAQGDFRINPHGPDFDPERVRDRSGISCGRCHFDFQLDSP